MPVPATPTRPRVFIRLTESLNKSLAGIRYIVILPYLVVTHPMAHGRPPEEVPDAQTDAHATGAPTTIKFSSDAAVNIEQRHTPGRRLRRQDVESPQISHSLPPWRWIHFAYKNKRGEILLEIEDLEH
ncbi:hypothetical protein DFP72DRAFT_841523 [Ephemerocybe angulata]|uniref:Uncharacterized protein n=1 Tax=Ephemerocybe angulata TaxID=980116 RepID=A0A8H6IFX5_9AGAR|nr:hypothetical protein DFP72DRAFT_841523 [Tulosesus angulatus]